MKQIINVYFSCSLKSIRQYQCLKSFYSTWIDKFTIGNARNIIQILNRRCWHPGWYYNCYKNCKRVQFKNYLLFFKPGKSHASIGCIVHVTEILESVLHLHLEFTFTTSVHKKLQHKIKNKSKLFFRVGEVTQWTHIVLKQSHISFVAWLKDCS